MQATTAQYNAHATADVRPLSWRVSAAFSKTIDPTIGFFILDTSLLDSTDILASEAGSVVQEWFQYVYGELTARVISLEWQREEEVPYSVNSAVADITFNNYDDFFAIDSASPADNILPRRPYKLLAGFGNINLAQFVGLSESTPKIDNSTRTATVHCTDFLSFIFSKPLDQTVILQDVKTDEVLAELFEFSDLLPSQYELDEGYNQIEFVYFEKGTLLGEAIRQLMQAELGSLYMDEVGIIRFKNRVRAAGNPVLTFNESNVEDYKISDADTIINVVQINSDIREVQASKAVVELTNTPEDPINIYWGIDTEVFFNFNDPVTTIQSVTDIVANSQPDGSGTNLSANVTVESYELFATAIKVTFNNSGANAYLTGLTINGTPAEVVRSLNFRLQDDDSVEAFEEQVYSITNNFIQSDDAANSIALSLLNFYKDHANTIELSVKGNHALQIGDNIRVWIKSLNQVYTITKIVNILSGGKFTQRLVGKVFNTPDYFILNTSLLDGTDVLAP